MELKERVARVFASEGALSRALPEHTVRAGQVEMARAVAQTMEDGGVLVVEAGTGVGKTFAYLVPALLSGERVLISTATKALQDQLFRRDIPLLRSILNVPVQVALLKGRSSYLCLHRMEFARSDGHLDDLASQQLARVELWSMTTRSGDLVELDGLDEAAPLVSAITSTRDNCLGSRCPQASRCHVNLARREAMAADVVVVNHHLFFADLNVRESGVAELLPSVKCVVFDEAHQLNETGVQFLGKQISTGQMGSLAADVVKVARDQARGFADWQGLAHDLNETAQNFANYCAERKLVGKVAWEALVTDAAWTQLLQVALGALQHMAQALSTVAQSSPDLQGLQTRCEGLLAQLQLFCLPATQGYARWLDAGDRVNLVESPLDIASEMQERLVRLGDLQPSHKSWIFTSATLGYDPELSWFVQSCGLHGARIVKVPSPFDYLRQASLFVPPDMPKPSDPSHSAAVAELAIAGAKVLGGRTMVLTTTLRAMRTIGTALANAFSGSQGIEVLVQGQMPKRELLERFGAPPKPADSAIVAGCVLVASVSFWEGIDIPGETLQLLVIDKLPFSPPDDPLQKARAAALEAQGKSPFKLLYLPQAGVALKQGAGRLIRRESDRGVLVVCDVRLTRMGYGKKLLAGLPRMAHLPDRAAFIARLEELTKPSTTDPCWAVPPESTVPTADS